MRPPGTPPSAQTSHSHGVRPRYPAVKRSGLLVCVLVCAGVLGAGCASGSSEDSSGQSGQPATAADSSLPEDADQTPEAPDPQPDTLAPTTPSPPEQEISSADDPAAPNEPAAPAEPSQEPEPTDEPAAPAEPSTEPEELAAAAGEPSGHETAPEPAQDESPTDGPVFPPVGEGAGVARWTVEIIESVLHDPGAFTQGLEMADGRMYESTGLRGRSSLRTIDPATGEVAARVDLPDELFGEGLTVVGDKIVQLTWQSEIALVYDRHTLEELGVHAYEGEGWGLCLSEDVLIMSNGSDRLARRDPETFELLGTVTVTASGYDGRLDYLNELECVQDLVIANVWQTDRLLVIDLESGRVVAAIDAGPLVDDVRRRATGDLDVLNGVAFDPDSATLWMTGKLWPRFYRVRIVEVP